MSVAILTGDCREVMADQGPFDLIIADPPYGDTALEWDTRVFGWTQVAASRLKPTGSMWLFGSLRFLLHLGTPPGFRYAQDIVWEKHNGSGLAADRFKRVHEHAVQFYLVGTPWAQVFNDVQRMPYAGADKSMRAPANRVGHQRKVGAYDYVDDGTRIARSVLKMPQPRDGRHGTQKPVSLLEILIRTSCPPGGLVGDFFSGSAPAGEAAATSGRSYVGAEIDPVTASAGRARLASNLFAGFQ